MITPERAWALVLKHCRVRPGIKVSIQNANGMILARNVPAGDDLPRFDNSSVDGYACRWRDIQGASSHHPVRLKRVGKHMAGSIHSIRIRKGECCRIATGAPLPLGADTVVMQEDCVIQTDHVLIEVRAGRGENVRKKGEEIRKGALALRRGEKLNPGTLGWLASMGVLHVHVVRRPVVGLIRSGNEVVDFHQQPGPGTIRDCHLTSLSLASCEAMCPFVASPIVGDRKADLRRAIRRLERQADLVLTTGGVSVGDLDLVVDVMKEEGWRLIFHKVSQKPGKPMAFGVKGSKIWIGLPGNPVAALVGFHLYVRTAIRKMSGERKPSPDWQKQRVRGKMIPDAHRTLFLRGTRNSNGVTLANLQGSHCLGSFRNTDVIVRVLPGRRAGGEKVDCHLI